MIQGSAAYGGALVNIPRKATEQCFLDGFYWISGWGLKGFELRPESVLTLYRPLIFYIFLSFFTFVSVYTDDYICISTLNPKPWTLNPKPYSGCCFGSNWLSVDREVYEGPGSTASASKKLKMTKKNIIEQFINLILILNNYDINIEINIYVYLCIYIFIYFRYNFICYQ